MDNTNYMEYCVVINCAKYCKPVYFRDYQLSRKMVSQGALSINSSRMWDFLRHTGISGLANFLCGII